LTPFADWFSNYANQILFTGAIILALLSKNRWLALLIIVPFALLIQGLRHLYWDLGVVPENKTVFTSFFLGITIGPIIVTLLELLNKEKRKELVRKDKKSIKLSKTKKRSEERRVGKESRA